MLTCAKRHMTTPVLAVALLLSLPAISCVVEGDGKYNFLDEEKHLQYIIEIDKEGNTHQVVSKPNSRSLIMSDRSGRRFACNLPLVDSVNGSNHSKENEIAMQSTPRELLSELDGHCAHRVEDWWTYEICFRRHVRQYHKEPDADNVMQIATEYMLGHLNESATDLDQLQTDTRQVDQPVRFVSEMYDGGEPCDVTGRPRQTEVRYICGSAAPEDIVGYMEETSTCTYIVNVVSPRLCNLPGFRVTAPPVEAVLCQVLPASGQLPILQAGPKENSESAQAHITEGDQSDGVPPPPAAVQEGHTYLPSGLSDLSGSSRVAAESSAEGDLMTTGGSDENQQAPSANSHNGIFHPSADSRETNPRSSEVGGAAEAHHGHSPARQQAQPVQAVQTEDARPLELGDMQRPLPNAGEVMQGTGPAQQPQQHRKAGHEQQETVQAEMPPQMHPPQPTVINTGIIQQQQHEQQQRQQQQLQEQEQQQLHLQQQQQRQEQLQQQQGWQQPQEQQVQPVTHLAGQGDQTQQGPTTLQAQAESMRQPGQPQQPGAAQISEQGQQHEQLESPLSDTSEQQPSPSMQVSDGGVAAGVASGVLETGVHRHDEL